MRVSREAEQRSEFPAQRQDLHHGVAVVPLRADRATVLPFAISLAHTERGFATSRAAEPWAPMGILIAFACRACGLTELYTLEADKIPIGPEHGTHLVDYTPVDGPLR